MNVKFCFEKSRKSDNISKMIIKTIQLENFRNYDKIKIALHPNLNVFVGNNAQGKTNLVEAVYLCGIGKSVRTSRERETIKWEKEHAKICIEAEKQFNKSKVEIALFKNDKKAVKINGLPIKRIGELMGEIPVVYFSPDEISLIKDGPQDRRRFMDIDISQLNKTYFYLLCRYDKVLQERNKLLKQTRSLDVLKDTISIWDEQLSDIASRIITYRINFINKLIKPANEVHKKITDGKENLEISYVGQTGETPEEIRQKLLVQYEKSVQKDFDIGYTTVGPHRDDIKIMINGVDIRNFGSQGQQRLATLSLKIAELEIFKEEKGESPILLLDDVLSELDETRKMNLLKCIKDIQSIITCTKFNYKTENCQIFNIESGSVKNWPSFFY